LKLNRGPVFADDGTERLLLQFGSSAFGNDLVFSHIMTLPCASTFTRNEDKDRAIGPSRATDSNSDLALGRIVMIAFFSLVRDDWAAKRESKISGDVRNSTRDDLKRRTTFNAAGASGVIRSMNPGFCSIIPETRTKRSQRNRKQK